MAPLAANDVNTWTPPIPSTVLAEAGYAPEAANVGTWAPNNTIGWTCQTYLNIAGVNITQTYAVEAPVIEEKPAAKPKAHRTKAGK
jgi:hypothetical protein